MQLLTQQIRSQLRLVLGWASLAILLGNAVGCQSQGQGVEAQSQSDAKLKIGVGKFTAIAGTKYLIAPAVVTEYDQGILESIESVREKKVGQIRNYLFFNPDDLASQWLLPHANYLFVETLELPLRQTERNGKADDKEVAAPKPARLFYYELVKVNTNGNKVLDDGDRKTIAVSEVSGNGYLELIKDVDWMLHRVMTSE